MSYRRLLTALLTAVIIPVATAAVYAQLGLSRARDKARVRNRARASGSAAIAVSAACGASRRTGRTARISTVSTTTAAGSTRAIVRENGGMGWWTDYPGADNNFSVRLGELTYVASR